MSLPNRPGTGKPVSGSDVTEEGRLSRRAWLLSALAVIVVLPAAALGLAVALADPNDWKPEIEAAVQRATGGALSLDGPIRITRSLDPWIEVSQVRLANLPGGSRSYMVPVDKIRAQVSLLALLRQRIEVTHLELTGPCILLEEVKGQPNCLFKSAGNASLGAGSGIPGWFHPELRIRNLQIVNGMINSRLPARTNVIGIRKLDVTHPRDGAPFDLTSTLVYSDFAPFDLALEAQPTGKLAAPWRTEVHFSAFNAHADASGTMTLGGNYDLAVTAAAPALEALNALLPSMHLPPLHDFSFETHITNGPVRGDLPVVGQTRLHIGSADCTKLIDGLTLGTVDATLDQVGGTARVKGQGHYEKEPLSLTGSAGVP
jgi:hypothetical protein